MKSDRGGKDGWIEQTFLLWTGSSTEERGEVCWHKVDWLSSAWPWQNAFSIHSLILSLPLCCLQFKGLLSPASSAPFSGVRGAPDSGWQPDDIPGRWRSRCEWMCTSVCVQTDLLCAHVFVRVHVCVQAIPTCHCLWVMWVAKRKNWSENLTRRNVAHQLLYNSSFMVLCQWI